MSTTRHTWQSSAPYLPPNLPGMLQTTYLTNEKYTITRWWDGKLWWDISPSRGAGMRVFKWPKGEAANGIKQPGWMKHYGPLKLRKITDQSKVRWGIPYKHYEPAEVLKYLVSTGKLTPNWQELYQSSMRDAGWK